MNQRAMLTKRLVKESLLELLEGCSISRITIVELCAKAGVNRSTFYAHYHSPYDVLREIGYDTAKEIKRRIESHGDASIRDQLLTTCTYVYETRDVQRILIQNTSIDDIQTMMKAIEFDSVFPESFPNKSSASSREEREIATVFLTSGIYSTIRHWILNDIDKSPEEIADIVFMMASKVASDLEPLRRRHIEGTRKLPVTRLP